MPVSSLGETRFEVPIRGIWTFRDQSGRPAYPASITYDCRPFSKARWREAKPGVVEQYREAVRWNSRHLLVMADGTWIIDHTDDVNPDIGDVTAPAHHFLVDHPVGKGLVVAAAVVGTVALVAGLAAALSDSA